MTTRKMAIDLQKLESRQPPCDRLTRMIEATPRPMTVNAAPCRRYPAVGRNRTVVVLSVAGPDLADVLRVLHVAAHDATGQMILYHDERFVT